ncbi:MAG: 4-hydroxy-tetrahydrodipicolinate reductase [Nitrosomonadaceae bacterium]|nr:4-hydroxy-tetrahydrodipicolinate reductase [Nitrosomonadaceae bacterium]|tara:strand:- start:350 stop:1156 length:807 start_codon:yes stop_codon:yes gene_type:complete
MSKLNIAVAGSSGRMGRSLLAAVMKDSALHLQVALEKDGSPYLKKDISALISIPSNVIITDNFSTALPGSDVLIDFTQPEATIKHLTVCRANGVKMVIGTTGFSLEQKNMLKEASKDIALVVAPNMSVGVNVTFKLLDIAAKVLGENYDIEIIEAHHRHKVDAPSGTALHMGEIAAKANGDNLSEVAVHGREGITGKRSSRAIGFSTIRGGDIVGDHTAMFVGTGERVEISHKAGSRATFTNGALRAVHFLGAKDKGLFDMQDVLGLR